MPSGKVTFSGTGMQGDQINIEIFDSDYERVSSETVFVRSDGTWYSSNIDLDGGDYNVLVGVPGREQKSEEFTITSSEPKSAIPEYQKNVFQWWSEGTVSDSEVMNGVEYLITSGVIRSPNIQILDDVTSDTSSVKSETVIPEYQKNVFQWWSQGLVSDSEVMNGVEYLITSGVIQSKNIQIFDTTASDVSDASSVAYGIDSRVSTGICVDDDCVADPGVHCGLDNDKCIPTWFGISQAWSDVHGGELTTRDNKYSCPEGICENFNELLESSYHVQMWNVALFSEYLELKNFESKILKDASDDMWNEYAENQNQNTMIQATSLETESRLAVEAVNQALKSLNYAIAVADLAKDVAVSNGVPVLELEEGVQEQQEIVESAVPELSNYADFRHEVFEIKKLQGKTDEEITQLINDSREYWESVALLNDVGNPTSSSGQFAAWTLFGDDSITDLESIMRKSSSLGPQFLDIYLTIDELKDYDTAKNYIGKESVVPELAPIISLGAPDIIKGHNMIKSESESIKNNNHPISEILP